jgi:hypothetical protein
MPTCAGGVWPFAVVAVAVVAFILSTNLSI